MKTLYREIAQFIGAMQRCKKEGNTEWYDKHKEYVVKLSANFMPRGSGFDVGTQIDLEKSTPERLVFNTSFHHMDENGYYVSWPTKHQVIVTASLAMELNIRITGKDRNGIKEFIHQCFDASLKRDVESFKHCVEKGIN